MQRIPDHHGLAGLEAEWGRSAYGDSQSVAFAVWGDHPLFQLNPVDHLYQVLLLIEVGTPDLDAHVVLRRGVEDPRDVIQQTHDVNRGRAVVLNRYRSLDIRRHERLDPRFIILLEQYCVQHGQFLLLQVDRSP